MSEEQQQDPNDVNIRAILKTCNKIASDENVELSEVIQAAMVNELWHANILKTEELHLAKGVMASRHPTQELNG